MRMLFKRIMKLVKRGMRYKSVATERLPILQEPEVCINTWQ